MNWVYMVLCQDGSYYTGWSTDPIRRFKAHAQGRGAKYTRAHGALALVYVNHPAPEGTRLAVKECRGSND